LMGFIRTGLGAVHPPYRFVAIKWPRTPGGASTNKRDQQKWQPVLRPIALLNY